MADFSYKRKSLGEESTQGFPKGKVLLDNQVNLVVSKLVVDSAYSSTVRLS